MASQVLSRRMMQTGNLERIRFQFVAAELLVRMGARIRERREAMGLSRADVARDMPGKVSENQLYRWEKGQHQPQPDTLEALAEVLQCEVAYLMASSAQEKTKTPDPFASADALKQLEQISRQVAELHRLLIGDPQDEELGGGLAARLLAAVESPQKQDIARPATRRAAARRKSA